MIGWVVNIDMDRPEKSKVLSASFYPKRRRFDTKEQAEAELCRLMVAYHRSMLASIEYLNKLEAA